MISTKNLKSIYFKFYSKLRTQLKLIEGPNEEIKEPMFYFNPFKFIL